MNALSLRSGRRARVGGLVGERVLKLAEPAGEEPAAHLRRRRRRARRRPRVVERGLGGEENHPPGFVVAAVGLFELGRERRPARELGRERVDGRAELVELGLVVLAGLALDERRVPLREEIIQRELDVGEREHGEDESRASRLASSRPGD